MSSLRFYSDLIGNKVSQLKDFLFHITGNASSDLTIKGQFAFNDTSKRINYHDGTAVRELVDKSYIDALLATGSAPPQAFNAATETTFPATNAKYIVTVAGMVQGVSLEVQDYLIPKSATPAAQASSWYVLQGNVDKANQLEVDTGIDNTKYVTSLGVAKRYLKIGDNTNTPTTKITSNGFSQYVRTTLDTTKVSIEGIHESAQLYHTFEVSSEAISFRHLKEATPMYLAFDKNGLHYGDNSNAEGYPPAYDTMLGTCLVTKDHIEYILTEKVTSKRHKSVQNLIAGFPTLVSHGLGLEDKTDCIVQAWVGANPVAVEVTAVDIHSIRVQSAVTLNNVKIVILAV